MRVKSKFWVSLVCVLALLMSLLPISTFAEEPTDTQSTTVEWDISKSKTATSLKADRTSDVTLSLPSSEEQLVTDVVFVLDKSTSTDVESSMIDMLTQLSEQVEETGAKVKVGIVIFNKVANSTLSLTELNEANMSAINDAIKAEFSSGTNIHAGLLAGKAMLDEDTSVDANRKYLILVSDGITYLFDSDTKAINSIQATNGENAVMAGNDCWGIRHYHEGGDHFIPASWETYLGQVGESLPQVEQYIQFYDSRDSSNYIPKGNVDLPTTVDVALYKSYQVFQDAVSTGYHCYAMAAESGAAASYPWAGSFMEYLQSVSGNGAADFEAIKNDIYYLVDSGSEVIDEIGYGDTYDFEFVNDADHLVLTVNDTPLAITSISENKYGFGDANGSKDGTTYPYILTYYPNGTEDNSNEHFVWEINVPVTNFDRVQLTYTVKLSYTETAVGDYVANTNASATLKYVSTDGQSGDELFSVPQVTYHIAQIQPADITIYMGGDNGYEGVSETDGTISGSNSLPEPGYYITLPAEINQALADVGLATEGTPADLSKYISIYTEGTGADHQWTLASYGNTYSAALGKYIYAIVPVDSAAPFRLTFTDEENNVYDSDTFNPASIGALSQNYKMNIYSEFVESKQAFLQISIPGGATYVCSVSTAPGDLDIRYVTGKQDSVVTSSFNSVAEASQADDPTKDALDKAYVIRDADTKFNINGSGVDVTEGGNFADVSLLFDDIVSPDNTNGVTDYSAAITDKAIETAAKDFENVKYEAKYLDLVDANNGNVWLTPSKAVTVYWPYPDGTDANTTFKLVHFVGLDRDMSVSDVESNIANAEVEVLDVKTDKYGISFTTDSFSPFVLLWDNTQTTTVTTTVNPTPTPTPDEHPDIAEAKANGTWGQPTPTPAATNVIPQTSDSMPVTLLAVLASVAAVAMILLVVVRKRRRDQ